MIQQIREETFKEDLIMGNPVMSKDQFERAVQFMKETARPLEQAWHAYEFEGGSAGDAPSGLRIDGKPVVELISTARLGIDLGRRAPSSTAVGRAGEPDAGLAVGVNILRRLVVRRLTAILAGEINPRHIHIVAQFIGVCRRAKP